MSNWSVLSCLGSLFSSNRFLLRYIITHNLVQCNLWLFGYSQRLFFYLSLAILRLFLFLFLKNREGNLGNCQSSFSIVLFFLFILLLLFSSFLHYLVALLALLLTVQRKICLWFLVVFFVFLLVLFIFLVLSFFQV